MNKFKIGAPMRFFLLIMTAVIMAGIWLTGFNSVHWLLYLPPAFFVFSAVTGLCPGMFISNSLFGKK